MGIVDTMGDSARGRGRGNGVGQARMEKLVMGSCSTLINSHRSKKGNRRKSAGRAGRRRLKHNRRRRRRASVRGVAAALERRRVSHTDEAFQSQMCANPTREAIF